MREQKNVLNYGFLLALIIIGIISFFYTDQMFINAVNSLSIPIFLFTISTLLAKGNNHIRTEVQKSISSQEKLVNDYDNLLHRYTKILAKNQQIGIDISSEDTDEINNLSKDTLTAHLYLKQLYKRHAVIDIFTIVINVLAMISFAFCILSLVGVINIKANFACINIFSLALVFFDFFVYDDILKKIVDKNSAKLRKIANEESKKEINES